MKAFEYYRYGPPLKVMKLVDKPTPEPGPGEVRLRLHAVGVNGSDWEITAGTPLYSRIFGPLRPRQPTLGSDIAGVVDAVGPDVTRFKPGDAAFGDVFGTWGGFAEACIAPADRLLPIPKGMSFPTAASFPQNGTNALQPIRDANVQVGQKVLILGACGAAGTLAMQLAKQAGATVTAIDKGIKLDLARELGADLLLDYLHEDVTKRAERYDLILDYSSCRSFLAYRRIMTSTGKYFFFGGSAGALGKLLVFGRLYTRKDGQTFRLEAVEQTLDKQREMANLIAKGTIKPVIAGTYRFKDIPQALERLRAGDAPGKLMIAFPNA